ncbi:hypothetical protein EDC01DRAFT_616492 [Geopyxis carbonaria]|nr:hypothetical protein EDC01DRAFT_616492 [Geopyxis carbonaria]
MSHFGVGHNEQWKPENRHQRANLVRRDSVRSDASISSFYSDVEMAQDEVFAGPTSESLPSSVASFHHRRRPRADSETSWSFYRHEGSEENLALGDEDAVMFEDDFDPSGHDEAHDAVSIHRKSSSIHGELEEDPLLMGRTSTCSEQHHLPRTSQMVHIDSEDLTIVITGFRTSRIGLCLYLSICFFSLGIGWLFFKWFPRLRVRLVGRRSGLGECDWVIVENQWKEFIVSTVQCRLYGQPLSTIFGQETSTLTRNFEDDYDHDPSIQDIRYIDYRYIRFIYNPLCHKFMLNLKWKDPSWDSLKALRVGLDGDSKGHRNIVFGDNLIDIEEKSIPQLLTDEAFHPFYVFQIASLVLWSMDQYYYYAGCIFVISAFSIISTLIETRSTMHRLREVARFTCDVRVLRSGFWRYISSTDLVPGDVYEVTDPGLSLFPCDSLLLTGDCIVNESMLTGESVPVSKMPCTHETIGMLEPAAPSVNPVIGKHFLYSGTKIIRARRPRNDTEDEAAALALVVRTGFNTTKGALVRSMLFPKPSTFKFYRDSFYYIGVMGIIALMGFGVSFINFVHLGLPLNLIIIRALDLITIVVPPALPATLTIGTSFALSRLKKHNIFCISPQRVNISGKLDVICFDKTGTLTEDGLDVLGVHCVRKDSEQFTELFKTVSELQTGVDTSSPNDVSSFESLFHTMTTCHSLRLIDNELVGDPLDLKMFEYTSWLFEEGESTGNNHTPPEAGSSDCMVSSGLSPSIVRPPELGAIFACVDTEQVSSSVELGVLKSFEFDSNLRRTSVIVKKFRASGGDVYLKGAPECMIDICNPSSFPAGFHELLEHYTRSGYRVIACATKHIESLSWIKAQKMKRETAESNLTFTGFIIFENKLKDTTAHTIDELSRASIRKVMCTGDNILTAISVAKNCRLIHDSVVFVPHFINGDSHNPNSSLTWQSTDDTPTMLDEKTLLPLPTSTGFNVSGPYNMHNMQNYCLAVTGDVFRWIIDYASEDYINRMLIRSQIFARMSPDEKHELVEKLQSLGYCVGFCGDGANDCGALKAADVGISLSEAEASVAAPFTSRKFDISCVPQLIREGRAALVTSFSCFKYMSLYSAIQFTSVSILYKFGSNLGDFQFLFIDLLLILPIAVFMGWSAPHPELHTKRPTASLVSRKVLTPLLGQIFITFMMQFLCYKLVQRQSWYQPPTFHKHKPNIANSANTTLFLVSCYQYIFAGVILSVGPPYRSPISSNIPFMLTTLLAISITTWMLFYCPTWLYDLMQLTNLSTTFMASLTGMSLIYFIAAYLGENYLFPRLANLIGLINKRLLRNETKKRKPYKLIQEKMRI